MLIEPSRSGDCAFISIMEPVDLLAASIALSSGLDQALVARELDRLAESPPGIAVLSRLSGTDGRTALMRAAAGIRKCHGHPSMS